MRLHALHLAWCAPPLAARLVICRSTAPPPVPVLTTLFACRLPERQSKCELEVDACVEDILNRQEVPAGLLLNVTD